MRSALRSILHDRADGNLAAVCDSENTERGSFRGRPAQAGAIRTRHKEEYSRGDAYSQGTGENVERILAFRRKLLAGWIVLGGFSGVAAGWAGASFGGGAGTPEAAHLNALFFVAATLGVHSVLLCLSVFFWMVGLIRGESGPLSRCAERVSGRIGARGAAVSWMHSGRRGVWRLAIVSHAGGLAFALGAMLAFALSTALRERYDFFWKTTLLQPDQIVAIFDALFTPLRGLGAAVPSVGEIRDAGVSAGRGWVGSDGFSDAIARRWASALLASIALYGVVPRLALLAVSGVGVHAADWIGSRALRRERMRASDSAAAAAARRRADARVGAGAPSLADGETGAPVVDDEREPGEAVVVLLDIDTERAAEIEARVGGTARLHRAAGHSERERVLRTLAESDTRASALTVIASLGETPTRGDVRFIGRARRAAGSDGCLVLVLGRSLGSGGSGHAERVRRRASLWRSAANEAGVPVERVIDFDLEHATRDDWVRLQRFARGEEAIADGSERASRLNDPGNRVASLRVALNLVGERFDAGEVGDRDLIELFSSIDRAFGVDRPDASISSSKDALIRRASDGARRLAETLPGWTPRRPGWMAAGALAAAAGTLGGIAAVGGGVGLLAASPLWPMYSAAGAAIGEALGRRFGDLYEEQPIDLSEETMRDRATRVRAAALHASVRFCAGMGHVSSSSVIERAFESAGEPPAAGVAAWCDTLCGALVDARGEVARTSGGRL